MLHCLREQDERLLRDGQSVLVLDRPVQVVVKLFDDRQDQRQVYDDAVAANVVALLDLISRCDPVPSLGRKFSRWCYPLSRSSEESAQMKAQGSDEAASDHEADELGRRGAVADRRPDARPARAHQEERRKTPTSSIVRPIGTGAAMTRPTADRPGAVGRFSRPNTLRFSGCLGTPSRP